MSKALEFIRDILLMLAILLCFYIGYLIITRPDSVGIWFGTMSRYLDAASESERKVERQKVIDELDYNLKVISPINADKF